MEFSKAVKSQAFVSGLACFLKPQALELKKTLSFPIPKKTPFPVMSCSIIKEEIAALKESLAEASNGNTFVVCAGDPHGFSTRNFMLLQVLGMVVPSLLATTVCKIYNMGLDDEAFQPFYPLLKELNHYDVTNWKEKLNIAWKRYDDCTIKNETHFLKQLKHIKGMARFYVARRRLHLQSSMPATEYYNCFSHLLFVDEESSEFEYLRHAQNPKALKLTQASDIGRIISTCKVLNPTQEKGNIVIIIKLSPPLLHDLDGYIRKMKEEGIAVTWLLDPLVTVPRGHQVLTWSLRKSLKCLRRIDNILGLLGFNLGGFYMETTADGSECKLDDETTMKNQARLDVELSLTALEELGLARLTIYPNGGSRMRMI